MSWTYTNDTELNELEKHLFFHSVYDNNIDYYGRIILLRGFELL